MAFVGPSPAKLYAIETWSKIYAYMTHSDYVVDVMTHEQYKQCTSGGANIKIDN